MTLTSASEGRLGWSAIPRIVAWLCLPSLLTCMAGATILLSAAVLPADLPLRAVIVETAAAEGVVFALPGLALTPGAAVMTVFVTMRKKWSSAVVWTLWILVLVSMAAVVPATNVASANYVYSTPRPAEEPPEWK